MFCSANVHSDMIQRDIVSSFLDKLLSIFLKYVNKDITRIIMVPVALS